MQETGIAIGWEGFLTELGAALAFMRDGALSILTQPWGQIQIAALIVLIMMARLVARTLEPAFLGWMKAGNLSENARSGIAVLMRRLPLAVFMLQSWIVVLLMRSLTWPSRSYLIAAAASIATIWLGISLIRKLVHNGFIARLLTLFVVALATLKVFGALDIAVSLLDAAAITVGAVHISILNVIESLFLLTLLMWLARLISTQVDRRLEHMDGFSPSMRVLIGKLLRMGLFALAILIGLQSLGLDLTTLTVFSGAIGLGIGFGLQKVTSNLLSGIILLLDKSVKPGDVIEVGNTFGWISKLGARFVSVVTRDGREYLIPNEDLITNQVVNWSYSNPKVRMEVTFGVSYQSDPLTVRALAIEAAKRPKRVLKSPAPVCHLTGFGDSSLDFVLRFWIADPSDGVVNIRSEVLLALWYGLKEAGISIPYPQLDLHVVDPKNAELHAGAPEEGEPHGKTATMDELPD